MLAGPILRISCDREVEFQEPVTLQLPLSLRERSDFPDSSLVLARVLFQQSDGEHRQWTEITDSLELPPSFDGTVIKFSIRHFSGYAKAAVLCVLLCLFYTCWMVQLCSRTIFYRVKGKPFLCYLGLLTKHSHSKLKRYDSKRDTRRFPVSRIEDRVESFELRVITSLY